MAMLTNIFFFIGVLHNSCRFCICAAQVMQTIMRFCTLCFVCFSAIFKNVTSEQIKNSRRAGAAARCRRRRPRRFFCMDGTRGASPWGAPRVLLFYLAISTAAAASARASAFRRATSSGSIGVFVSCTAASASAPRARSATRQGAAQCM